jgi:very-short-patch-repair endonuclease
MTQDWLRTAAEQAGAVSLSQLRAAGVSPVEVRALVRRGVLDPASRGVYLLAGTERTWPCQLWLGLLAAGPESFVCRRSAAALWGLDGVSRGDVDVATFGGRHSRKPGAVRLKSVDAAEVVLHQGFRVTTIARTLVDLGSVARPEIVERGVECALRRRLVALAALTDLAEGARTPGSRALREVLRLRPDGAPPTESDAETLFVQIARSMGLPPPRRQFVVILRGQKYRLDFAWPAIRLAVEIDGAAVHGPDRLAADLFRQNQILLDGWLVVRFAAATVSGRPLLVERDLRDAWQLRSILSRVAT